MKRHFLVEKMSHFFRNIKNYGDDDDDQHRKKESAEKLSDDISVKFFNLKCI